MDLKPKQNRGYSRQILTLSHGLWAHLFWAHKLMLFPYTKKKKKKDNESNFLFYLHRRKTAYIKPFERFMTPLNPLFKW